MASKFEPDIAVAVEIIHPKQKLEILQSDYKSPNVALRSALKSNDAGHKEHVRAINKRFKYNKSLDKNKKPCLHAFVRASTAKLCYPRDKFWCQCITEAARTCSDVREGNIKERELFVDASVLTLSVYIASALCVENLFKQLYAW